MTLVASFHKLAEQIEALQQSFNHLHWAIVEGKPNADVEFHVLTLQDELLRWQGLLTDATDAVHRAGEQIQTSYHLQQIQQELTSCHESVIQVSCDFYNSVVTSDAYGDLLELACQDEREWAQWASGVCDAFSHCPDQLIAIERALLQAWQELTDSRYITMISTQATATSSQIYRPEPGGQVPI